MPHLRAAPQTGGSGLGFDPGRNLLIMPARKETRLFLVAGKDLTVTIPDGTVASCTERAPAGWEVRNAGLTPWESMQNLRGLTVSGVNIGNTTLNARTADGRDWIAPLTISVVNDPEYRAVNDSVVNEPLATALRTATSFREALVLLARDQMYSALGRSPSLGDGRYGLKAGVNWCGAFVQWLYMRTAAARGVTNPFGNNVDTLASPQKAIGWALHFPTLASLVRYQGGDPFGLNWGQPAPAAPLTQSFVDLDAANRVQRGDVALYRDATNWHHVCMVLDPPPIGGGAFTTIDGNQTGAFRADGGMSNECIGENSHDANDALPGVSNYKWVFLRTLTV